MGYRGQPGDLDIWVRASDANAGRVISALEDFGVPLWDLSADDLTQPGQVFQIGVAPSRIDLLSSISRVRFEDAWENRLAIRVEGLSVPVLGKKEFIANKQAAARPRDLSDLQLLAEAEEE